MFQLSQASQVSCTYTAGNLLTGNLFTSKAGWCLVQILSEDELRKVFTSGLHPPEWAALRLVSQRWKATVNSCAGCVNVGLTVAELAPHTEEKGATSVW